MQENNGDFFSISKCEKLIETHFCSTHCYCKKKQQKKTWKPCAVFFSFHNITLICVGSCSCSRKQKMCVSTSHCHRPLLRVIVLLPDHSSQLWVMQQFSVSRCRNEKKRTHSSSHHSIHTHTCRLPTWPHSDALLGCYQHRSLLW